MTPALAVALDAVERLLQEQAGALRTGDADALPMLTERVRQGLALVARTVGRGPVSDATALRLVAMQLRATGSMAMLARRQRDVEQSLQSLGTGHAGLAEMQARRVYGAQGGMAATAWRSKSFELA